MKPPTLNQMMQMSTEELGAVLTESTAQMTMGDVTEFQARIVDAVKVLVGADEPTAALVIRARTTILARVKDAVERGVRREVNAHEQKIYGVEP